MNGDEWIFILGGNTENGYGASIPSFTLATHILTNQEDDGYAEDKDDKRAKNWQLCHPPYAIQKNGIINYRNEYIISFGGDVIRGRKVKSYRRTNHVYLLCLTDDKYGFKARMWYQLPFLNKSGHYKAKLFSGLL